MSEISYTQKKFFPFFFFLGRQKWSSPGSLLSLEIASYSMHTCGKKLHIVNQCVLWLCISACFPLKPQMENVWLPPNYLEISPSETVILFLTVTQGSFKRRTGFLKVSVNTPSPKHYASLKEILDMFTREYEQRSCPCDFVPWVHYSNARGVILII